MKGWYRTTFADGSTVDKEAEGADQAKKAAKNERYLEIDPALTMNAADRHGHPRVQVTKVEEIPANREESRGGFPTLR